VAIHVSSIEKFWLALLAAVERPELNTDPRFCDRRSRVRNYRLLVEELRAVFAQRPSTEWVERLGAADVPAAGVNSVPEAMQDPEVEHLRLFHRMTHPQFGEQTMMHRSVRINGERESDPTLPPVLGEHSDAVLGDFGFSSAEIATLRGSRVV
jgi:formyl-CoA transferase